jgi:predicted  nucleic acid-binding Zn-ribbon protein
MTKVDDILADLRNGTSLEVIQKKYRSWGQKTEAYRIYVAELDQDAQKERDQLSPLTSKIKDLQGQRDSMETQVRRLKDLIQRSEKEHKSWEEKTAKEKGQLESELEGLKETIEKRRGELDKINLTLSDLSSRGVTIEVVTRIDDMEFQANENLIEIVKTAAERNRVRIELFELMEKKKGIEKEISSLEKKVEGLRDNIQAEKNTLDESQSKTRTFQEAMNITGWFFSQGYRTEDLKSIKDAIELVGIKGDPTLSVDRLMRGVEEAGSLNNLRDNIKKSREELRTLRDNINSAEGKLTAILGFLVSAR